MGGGCELTSLFRGAEPKHSQQPPGVVQNWSTLQCSKHDIEQCGYDHAPVTRGRMRTQFPLPHGPMSSPPPCPSPGGGGEPLVVPRLNFCLRLQCLGSFPVFVFVNPWTGLSSPIRPNRCQPRSGWQRKPKKFKNSDSNSPEWLPPLSVPEINRALEKPQLAQWMRLMLSNIKAYVRLRAGEVGEIPRPSEFGGQATEAAVDPGEPLAWRVWDCVSQSQAAYARKYAGTQGKSSSESSQYATLEEAWKEQGSAFTWRSVKFREVGGVLQRQSRQGEWIPVESPPSGGCQRCAQRGSPDERHWHFRCPPRS